MCFHARPPRSSRGSGATAGVRSLPRRRSPRMRWHLRPWVLGRRARGQLADPSFQESQINPNT